MLMKIDVPRRGTLEVNALALLTLWGIESLRRRKRKYPFVIRGLLSPFTSLVVRLARSFVTFYLTKWPEFFAASEQFGRSKLGQLKAKRDGNVNLSQSFSL